MVMLSASATTGTAHLVLLLLTTAAAVFLIRKALQWIRYYRCLSRLPGPKAHWLTGNLDLFYERDKPLSYSEFIASPPFAPQAFFQPLVLLIPCSAITRARGRSTSRSPVITND